MRKIQENLRAPADRDLVEEVCHDLLNRAMLCEKDDLASATAVECRAKEAALRRMLAIGDAAVKFQPKLESLRRQFPPPDSWRADVTYIARVELTVSQWNSMERLRKALDDLHTLPTP